ncbi:MAG: LysE/ArgO family amino acid transporter [Kangiellaceae bacterium]
MNFLPLVQGFVLGGSMIIPIGAQNAFIIDQGIKRQFHLFAASLCIFFDLLLISLGIFGGGELIASNALLSMGLTWMGVVFLSVYGFMSFNSAYKLHISKNKVFESTKSSSNKTITKVIITCFGVTLLNPHAYIDTVVILGGVGGQFIGTGKVLFAIGCMIASICWFYGLSLSASRMSHILSQTKVKMGIDIVVGMIMLIIAFGLSRQL